MEKETIEKDIKILCLKAKSFPDGVLEAHQKLHAIIQFSENRKYFGISRPENGTIEYKAAAEILNNEEETENNNLETIVLKKGEYVCKTVHDYMKNIEGIGKAFQEMLNNPNLDPEGYCVEWYLDNKDVKCMIRLKD